jgi:hypothetical protein
MQRGRPGPKSGWFVGSFSLSPLPSWACPHRTKAHEVLGTSGPYLEAAVRAAEAVWRRGLLHKGPGLCHGVGGTGITLLHMYRATGDRLWLYRAVSVATFL